MIDSKLNSGSQAGDAEPLSERDETWQKLIHNLGSRLKDRAFREYLEASDAMLDGYRDRYMPLDVLSDRIRGAPATSCTRPRGPTSRPRPSSDGCVGDAW